MSINTNVLTDQRPTYSLEPRDIAAYLALVGDNEPVGVPCNSQGCLLAEALKCKYATQTVSVFCGMASVNYQSFSFSHEMHWLRSSFDFCFPDDVPVTKAQLMAFLTSMVAEGAWTW